MNFLSRIFSILSNRSTHQTPKNDFTPVSNQDFEKWDTLTAEQQVDLFLRHDEERDEALSVQGNFPISNEFITILKQKIGFEEEPVETGPNPYLTTYFSQKIHDAFKIFPTLSGLSNKEFLKQINGMPSDKKTCFMASLCSERSSLFNLLEKNENSFSDLSLSGSEEFHLLKENLKQIPQMHEVEFGANLKSFVLPAIFECVEHKISKETLLNSDPKTQIQATGIFSELMLFSGTADKLLDDFLQELHIPDLVIQEHNRISDEISSKIATWEDEELTEKTIQMFLRPFGISDEERMACSTTLARQICTTAKWSNDISCQPSDDEHYNGYHRLPGNTRIAGEIAFSKSELKCINPFRAVGHETWHHGEHVLSVRSHPKLFSDLDTNIKEENSFITEDEAIHHFAKTVLCMSSDGVPAYKGYQYGETFYKNQLSERDADHFGEIYNEKMTQALSIAISKRPALAARMILETAQDIMQHLYLIKDEHSGELSELKNDEMRTAQQAIDVLEEQIQSNKSNLLQNISDTIQAVYSATFYTSLKEGGHLLESSDEKLAYFIDNGPELLRILKNSCDNTKTASPEKSCITEAGLQGNQSPQTLTICS